MTDGHRRTAIVFGGSGFIGSHLVPALAEIYDVVDVLDLVPPATSPPGTYLAGDVLDLLPDLDRYDAVFHLAATVGGRGTLEIAPLTIAGNLALDVEFFRFVARTRPAHAVYMSSSAVYPGRSDSVDGAIDERWVPFAEESVCAEAALLGQPDGIYGWIKLTGERLGRVTAEHSGVPVTCYRPFTIYGPGQVVDYPVPAICARALDRQDPIEVWGSGLQQRDFIHVTDAVAAIVASHRDGAEFATINLCTGVATTFAELALIAARAVGYDTEVKPDRSKPGGVRFRVGSPARTTRWHRNRISIEEGIGQLVALGGCANTPE